VYCSNSLKPRYAHIWVRLSNSASLFSQSYLLTNFHQLTIVNSVIVGAAVTSLIRLFAWTKKEMDPKHKPLAKLITFKGIVFFQFISGVRRPCPRFCFNLPPTSPHPTQTTKTNPVAPAKHRSSSASSTAN
jgi:hypothetical protein